MTQGEIDAALRAAADEKYREFNARIVNSKLPMWGVRAPVIQKLAKTVAKTGGDFLDTYEAENFEQILLYALAVAYAKMPLREKFPYIEKVLPKFDNWAHVDMMLGAFKQAEKERDVFLDRYRSLATGNEFERRFLAVFLMDYCLTPAYLPTVFALYEQMQCGYYYTNMGIAWGLSVALVKQYDQTLAFLRKGTLNEFIRKKTVQKARESYRISPEQKQELKTLFG